jgi:Flp pilus assembly protein TadG
MGLVEVAFLMRAQLVLTNATREGARLASRGREDTEVAGRAVSAFSRQLPVRTLGADANTGIMITRFYVPPLPEETPITMTTYFSGTFAFGTNTCESTIAPGYWYTLTQQNEGFEGPHDVAVVEACHYYDLAFFPVQRMLYDRTIMRISTQRTQ